MDRREVGEAMSWKQGDRVVLVRCTDSYTKLQPGMGGEVTFVDSLDTIHILWDDGHQLGICLDAGDRIRREGKKS